MALVIAYSLYLLVFGVLVVCLYQKGRVRGLRAGDIAQRVLITLVTIGPLLVGAPLDGLEYEDAYIHKSAARYQLGDTQEPSEGFFARTCVVGSISKCAATAGYSTHVIGFSALISGVSWFLGYSARLGNVLSMMCWVLTVQCFWSVLGTQVSQPLVRVIGLGLLLSSPAMYVIGGSAFAEPLFGFLLMLCIWQFLNRRNTGAEGWIFYANVVLWIGTLLLLSLSKKEGALFIGLVSVWDVVQCVRSSAAAGGRARALLWAAGSVSAFVIAIWVFKLLEAAARHSVDIGRSAFDVEFVPQLVLPLVEAAGSPWYFGAAWTSFCASVLLLRKSRNETAVLLSVVVGGYLALYVSHARHYWFVGGQVVQPGEMVRYVYALTPLACLVTASLVSHLVTRIGTDVKPTVARMVRLGVVLGGAIGLVAGQMRAVAAEADMSREEESSWGGSLRVIASVENGGNIFVSSRSVALYIYVDDNVQLLDFVALGHPRLRSLLSELASERNVVILDGDICVQDLVRDRWPQACDTLRWLRENPGKPNASSAQDEW